MVRIHAHALTEMHMDRMRLSRKTGRMLGIDWLINTKTSLNYDKKEIKYLIFKDYRNNFKI